MKIAIASDHAGFMLKQFLLSELSQIHQMVDLGTNSTNSMDYPDVAHPLARLVESKECEMGIIICGSGNGVNITVNKHSGIRAALCWTIELAELARQHNNANVLSLPARFVSNELALEMAKAFINTDFEGGRHQIRVEKI